MSTSAITSAPVNGHHMAHKTPIRHRDASKWFKVVPWQEADFEVSLTLIYVCVFVLVLLCLQQIKMRKKIKIKKNIATSLTYVA